MSHSELALILLADATVETAANMATRRRQAEADRQRRETTETAEMLRRERGQKWRNVWQPVVALLGLSIPVWVLTPVVGSFISAFSDNFTLIIFGAGEKGNTAGSGPEGLYVLLLWLLPATILILGICGFVLPYPRGVEVISPYSAGGFFVGFLIVMYQGFAGGGSHATWWWPFVLSAGLHLGYGVVLRVREESLVRNQGS